MEKIFGNTGYFLKEVKTIIKTNLMSNVFSLISTGLIFFILSMVTTGWFVSGRVVEAIKGEAEINVYYSENTNDGDAVRLADNIKAIDGVKDVRMVDKNEAYRRMEDILGKDARVLKLLNENPFNPFIEVKIDLEKMDSVLNGLNQTKGIEYIRDNRQVLDKIRSISSVMNILSFLILTAAGVSTLVIISHIIRLGIYNSREQINTLRLLGAPDTFIAFPFFLEGLFLTLGGGILSSGLSVLVIKYFYSQLSGPLPFIPLPPLGQVISSLIILIASLSAALGIIGSLLGLSSAGD